MMKFVCMTLLVLLIAASCVLIPGKIEPGTSWHMHRHRWPAVFGSYLIFENGRVWNQKEVNKW